MLKDFQPNINAINTDILNLIIAIIKVERIFMILPMSAITNMLTGTSGPTGGKV